MNARPALKIFGSALLPIAVFVACGGSDKRSGFGTEEDGGPIGFAEAGGFEGGTGEGGVPLGRDPVTCDEAREAKTYVGCDYWPTVTANPVQNVFDFAVAVANVGTDDAKVTVTGPNGVSESVTVKGGSLEKIYLPWVTALKGAQNTGAMSSVLAKASAYHLVSDKPVVVYQFNPLEFRAQGGPPGKNWSACVSQSINGECYSYSNDASLLLPSTAMTGTYRIMGAQGFSRHPIDPFTGEVNPSAPLQHNMSAYFVVTATQDGTKVDVKLGPKGKVVAGGGIMAAPAGGTLSLTLDAGDVAAVVSDKGRDFDFSGSLLTADKPVQVITGVPCMDFPLDVQACDHIEETVFPAETLGKHYVVTRPTGPKANNVGHVVRLYGNVDGTNLTYTPSKPAGCPDTLSAGQVVDCGEEVTTDFEVSGDKEFGVGMFMLGGEKADPDFNPGSLTQPQGDPSQSFAVTVEQYRKRYVFLAPADYKTSYVDVVASNGTKLSVDGTDVSSQLTKIGGTSWFIARVKLGAGKDGVHVLEADQPVGIQVIGYGDNTSYMYPGGLNLGQIAPPPVK